MHSQDMANGCRRPSLIYVRMPLPQNQSDCKTFAFLRSSRVTTEIEPQITLRGHSAAITRLIHAPSKRLLYSASLDSSIRVWALPSPSHTTYAPYDDSTFRGHLVGHTDAVWDLALARDESTLISCGAEGAVKVWDVGGPSPGALKLTWGWLGVDGISDAPTDDNRDAPGATSIEAIKSDLKKVAVAYQNAVVKIFDIETGKELSRLGSDMSYGTLIHFVAVSTLSFVTLVLFPFFRWYACDASQLYNVTSNNVITGYRP